MSSPRVVVSQTPAQEVRTANLSPAVRTFVCDHCSRSFAGPPAGSGLLIWTRGDEVRYEEPPLCDDCALTLTTTAMMAWWPDDDEE
jgi:hypothetical protein